MRYKFCPFVVQFKGLIFFLIWSFKPPSSFCYFKPCPVSPEICFSLISFPLHTQTHTPTRTHTVSILSIYIIYTYIYSSVNRRLLLIGQMFGLIDANKMHLLLVWVSLEIRLTRRQVCSCAFLSVVCACGLHESCNFRFSIDLFGRSTNGVPIRLLLKGLQ